MGHRSTPFVLPMKKPVPTKPKPAKTLSRLTTKRRGEVAEAAFLHKAASFGFTVAKPWGESDRFDFLVQSGSRCWRGQVKSAYTQSEWGYGFHACGNVQSQTYTRDDIDFLVAYIVPENVWYVVPSRYSRREQPSSFSPPASAECPASRNIAKHGA